VSKGVEMASEVFHELKQSRLEAGCDAAGANCKFTLIYLVLFSGLFDLKGTVSLLLNYDEVDIFFYIYNILDA
jgi:hypothetical protein